MHTKVRVPVQEPFRMSGNKVYLLIFVNLHSPYSDPNQHSEYGSGSWTAKSMRINNTDIQHYNMVLYNIALVNV